MPSEILGNFIANMTSSILNMSCIANSEIQVANLDGLVVEYLEMISRDKSSCLIAIGHSVEHQADFAVSQRIRCFRKALHFFNV